LHHPILRPGEIEAENREARQALLTLLKQVPRNKWVSFSAFALFLYRLNPLFLQKKQRFYTMPHWWLEKQAGRPLRPLQKAEWQQAEQYYLAQLLNGPLRWWGICDVAYDADGHLIAFRMRSDVALFSGEAGFEQGVEESDMRAESPQNGASIAGAIEVIDKETLLVDCSVKSWPALELLERFAVAAGVRTGKLCYQLQPAVLGEAISRREPSDDLLAFLRMMQQQYSDEQREAMLAMLERRINNYGRVRVYTGVTLLETADMQAMRELLAVTSIDGQVVHEITPTLLILKRAGAEQIYEELKKRGQAPLLHEEDVFYGAE
jgi:hypothetical protein